MDLRLASRRLLLIGTPLVLALLMIVHQLIDQFERPVAFLALHLLLLPLFALMGVAVWVLLEGVGGTVAWAARVAAFVLVLGRLRHPGRDLRHSGQRPPCLRAPVVDGGHAGTVCLGARGTPNHGGDPRLACVCALGCLGTVPDRAAARSARPSGSDYPLAQPEPRRDEGGCRFRRLRCGRGVVGVLSRRASPAWRARDSSCLGLPQGFSPRTSQNSVITKFSLPHHPGPESLACEGPKYGWVLSVSYVCQAMNPRHST